MPHVPAAQEGVGGIGAFGFGHPDEKQQEEKREMHPHIDAKPLPRRN